MGGVMKKSMHADCFLTAFAGHDGLFEGLPSSLERPSRSVKTSCFDSVKLVVRALGQHFQLYAFGRESFARPQGCRTNQSDRDVLTLWELQRPFEDVESAIGVSSSDRQSREKHEHIFFSRDQQAVLAAVVTDLGGVACIPHLDANG